MSGHEGASMEMPRWEEALVIAVLADKVIE